MNNLATTHNIEPVATVKKIIRLKRVIELTGLSRSTIYDRINPKSKRYDISFPKSIKLGHHISVQERWDGLNQRFRSGFSNVSKPVNQHSHLIITA
jgi:predicted DNA-binding transcriptional regulator AlpA